MPLSMAIFASMLAEVVEITQLSSLCQDAKRFGNQALQFLPQLGSRGNANGTAAALHLTLALLGGHRR